MKKNKHLAVVNLGGIGSADTRTVADNGSDGTC